MTDKGDQSTPRTIEGQHVVAPGTRFAVVASRFNQFIVERLIDGALDALVRHGASASNIVVARVPGAWEIPLACSRMAVQGRFDAIVAIGCVVRGATPHFDHVAAEVSKGIAQVSLSSGVPIAFGVLTADNLEQAIERAGTKMGNKGWDSALSAIEMVSLLRTIDGKAPARAEASRREPLR
jgi:6,7-dimethyl-8-ribityllumazine synthase